MAVFT